MKEIDLINFEDNIATLFNDAKIKAPIHLYSGNEEFLIKFFKKIKKNDWVLCSWRSHYQCLLKGVPPRDVKNEIMIQYGLLLHHLDHLPSASVTFHKPVTGVDATNEIINLLNMEEIYCPNYDAKYKYISDSGHNWREDPVEALMKYDHVHINTHPVWYNEKELSMEDCLLNLRLDIEADKRILKEVKVIKDYLVHISNE